MRSRCCARAASGQAAASLHSITSSARASTVGGMVRPSAFAVLRLTIRSYLVGACSGRSSRFAAAGIRAACDAPQHEANVLAPFRQTRPGRQTVWPSEPKGCDAILITAALAGRARRPRAARPESRARKWIGAAKAALPPYRRPALIERRIAAVLDTALGIGRAPAPAGGGRLAPLRRRTTLCLSVGQQQSHHCDAE
jgi:hypothetical protein